MANPFALVELDGAYADLVRAIEEQGGEPTPEQEQALDQYCAAMVGKADFFVNVKGLLDTGEDYCKTMIAKFQSKLASIDRERERWASAMLLHMDNMGVTVQEGELGKVRIMTSESVEAHVDTVPEQYRRTKIVVDADKTAIKKDLKAGVEIPGARLVERRYIRVF